MSIRQVVKRHWAIASAFAFVAFVGLVAVALLTLAPTGSGGGGGGGGGRSVMASDRLESMLTSGDLHEMLEQHQDMMQAMRVDSSPAMLARMKNDPMWQMLESGDLIKLMEEHQANIDRMLAED